MNDRNAGGRVLVLASGNKGKLREISELLRPLEWEVRPQSEWDVPEAVEDGQSFLENALIKARHAARLTCRPALADDSGLVVDALNGAPGIYSARYAGGAGDEANYRKLLEALDATGDESRGAHFYCAMALLRNAGDPAPIVAVGRWDGRIAPQPSGAGGFGYDPVFFIPEKGCTAAELPAEVKNAMSHRGRALRELLRLLRDEYDA
ncbi:MAG: RdgB/HAM1 family non-canonical purine NTP pyrophosphatase [Xanthomonadales bacterium]|jgi:XTP/dITP diphosphohydrolase|nr:RdgB/HAM1 family non-canonical purine NTP pyrophosphatase [Xanthomonadales bacterium]